MRTDKTQHKFRPRGKVKLYTLLKSPVDKTKLCIYHTSKTIVKGSWTTNTVRSKHKHLNVAAVKEDKRCVIPPVDVSSVDG